MLGFAIAFATMALGALIGSDALAGVGIASFIILAAFELIKPQPKARPAPEGGGVRYRHKLLEAPQDAWENDDAALWQHMMGMPGGGMMQKGGAGMPGIMGIIGDAMPNPEMHGMLTRSDPFGSTFVSREWVKNPSTGKMEPKETGKMASSMGSYRVRDFLPFPGYGRQSILEQIFIGMPLSITAMLKGKK
jgi:hypothetical protein